MSKQLIRYSNDRISLSAFVPVHSLFLEYYNDKEMGLVWGKIYVYTNIGKDGKCWASCSTLAKELNLSNATVRRRIWKLRSLGYIVLVEKPQRGKPNVYISNAGRVEDDWQEYKNKTLNS